MSDYIGDFPQDQTIYHLWPTNTSVGASVTRATDGTLSVYKDNGETQVTTGVTDDEDFDTTTGIHMCTIVTTNVWYAPAHDYTVVLSAATIDGQTVNAPIFSFSIENRTGSPQAGAGEYTYTMYTDEDGETGEIEGVDVWITTDEAGTITIWRGVTLSLIHI